MQRLHNGTGFTLKITALRTAILIAPADMIAKRILEVVLAHILITPAAFVRRLEAVNQIALTLQLFTRQRTQLVRQIDIIISILAVMRKDKFSGTHRFNAFDHRLGYRNDRKRNTALGGVLLQRIERRTQIALTYRSEITVVLTVERRHLDQQKAVPEANLRVVMAAPHEQVDKASFAQMVIIVRTTFLDRCLIF